MDRPTLAAYDRDAAAFAKDWHEQPAPSDLHDIVKRFFIVGGATADIGCGSGREVAWLNVNGYPAKGFDASNGLLSEARTRYPQFEFAHAELPGLGGIAANAFDNVLCETVIMHLDRVLVPPSVRRIFEILKPGGVFYLSWRVTEGDDQRDKYERLYAAFEPSLVRSELTAADDTARRGAHQCLLRQEDCPYRGAQSGVTACLANKEPRPGGGTGRGLDVRPPLRQAGLKLQAICRG